MRMKVHRDQHSDGLLVVYKIIGKNSVRHKWASNDTMVGSPFVSGAPSARNTMVRKKKVLFYGGMYLSEPTLDPKITYSPMFHAPHFVLIAIPLVLPRVNFYTVYLHPRVSVHPVVSVHTIQGILKSRFRVVLQFYFVVCVAHR